MIWRIPGISLNLHYPKEDDGELYTACPIIKGSRGIEPLNPLPQRRIRLTLPAYLCLKTALRRSEIREYYTVTKREGESYEDFVRRAKQNPIGRVVKLHDLEDNLNALRLDHFDADMAARYNKYLAARRFLLE